MERQEIQENINALAKAISEEQPLFAFPLDASQEEAILISAAAYYKLFMENLGIDLNDPNSIETPYRVSKMFLKEKCTALHESPPVLTLFPNEKKQDEYVVVKDIPYYSICSHHHVVFYGKAHVVYHPKDTLVGISKFARVVNYFAAKPQLQEGMTQEIVDYLFEKLSPVGLMVVVTGQHMCMTSRGAKAEGSITITSAIKGIENGFDKNEAMHLIKM